MQISFTNYAFVFFKKRLASHVLTGTSYNFKLAYAITIEAKNTKAAIDHASSIDTLLSTT